MTLKYCWHIFSADVTNIQNSDRNMQLFDTAFTAYRSTCLSIKQGGIFILLLKMINRAGRFLPLLEEWRYLIWFSLADFTVRWVPGFFTLLHEDYENILCSYISEESLLHRKDKKRLCVRIGEPWSFAVCLHGFLSSLS